MTMTQVSQEYHTVFGSLENYEKGGVQVINDDPKHYAFSNVFEICNNSKAYERVAMGINQIYVLEAVRAEGTSPWYVCAHDEFALCMDKEVEIHLVKLDVSPVDPEKNGAVLVEGEPEGRKMGWMKLRRGHQALLPANCAYQFRAEQPAVVVIQTCLGDLTVQKWAEICQTR
jgi:hypothetical protein